MMAQLGGLGCGTNIPSVADVASCRLGARPFQEYRRVPRR